MMCRLMGLFWTAEVVLIESLEAGGVVELVKVDLPQDVAWRQATALEFNPEVSPASTINAACSQPTCLHPHTQS